MVTCGSYEPSTFPSLLSLPTDNGPLAADLARIDDATHINRWKNIDLYQIAEIDQYQVAMCTTDDKSEVRVVISSVAI